MISRFPTDQTVSDNGITIPSYMGSSSNIDKDTVEAFGEEWENFSKFSPDEIEKIGFDYFHLITREKWETIKSALDVGCGSGRWTQYVAQKVPEVISVDPSKAVFVAARNCQHLQNVTILHANVSELPFAPEQFDLVFSLGVLHHVPDTFRAIKDCAQHVKIGGWFLIYLYYNLDNRGILFKSLFALANILRNFIFRLPRMPRDILCDIIALTIYYPLAKISKFIEFVAGPSAAASLPLNYYRKTSFFVMRNDSRDRFGTPLEQRFSRKKIHEMLTNAGFSNITFSEQQPFWVALAQKF